MRYINLHLHYITLRITHGHRNRYVSIGQAIYDFLLTFHSNHGPISYRFRNKRRFQSKNFPTPCICPPAEGVPLELGTGARDRKQTRIKGLSETEV